MKHGGKYAWRVRAYDFIYLKNVYLKDEQGNLILDEFGHPVHASIGSKNISEWSNPLYFQISEKLGFALHIFEGTSILPPTPGPPLAGVQVTGTDGAGNTFSETTDAQGNVVIQGVPGTWQLTIAKPGYQTRTWSWPVKDGMSGWMNIAELILRLYVHDSTADGPLLSMVRVTGKEAAGRDFDEFTYPEYTEIGGSPGTWHFSAAKKGYLTNTWAQSILETDVKHAYISSF